MLSESLLIIYMYMFIYVCCYFQLQAMAKLDFLWFVFICCKCSMNRA